MTQHLKDFYNSKVKTTEMPEFEELSGQYKLFLCKNASFKIYMREEFSKMNSKKQKSSIDEIVVFLILIAVAFVITAIYFIVNMWLDFAAAVIYICIFWYILVSQKE